MATPASCFESYDVMKTPLALVFLALPVLAEDLHPRLAPLAATYAKEVESIESKAGTSREKPKEEYLAQLKTAEQRATKSGDVTVLAALTKEIDNVEKGIYLPVPDVHLPKLVQSQHARFHRALEGVDAAAIKDRKALDAKFLASLAKIAPADGSEPDLASQIAEQKRRVIAGISGPITNVQTQIGGTRWQSVPNPGHFEYFGPDGRFSHWKYTTPAPDTVVLHWNVNSSVTWKLAKDGKTLLKHGVPDLKFVSREAPK